ncbi:MAG: hypothetical protein AAFX52_13810 [Pseudomonadota bacterium]
MKNRNWLLAFCSIVLTPTLSVASAENGNQDAQSPKSISALPGGFYYDRHRIDVSNLREFYEGVMIGDMMIHADGMFDATTKWKMTLYQMVRGGSRHFQARSAYQLSRLGVRNNEIHAIWQPDYIETIEDERIKAAFTLIDAVSVLPANVTADTHALLRTHFIDRQIAELIELASYNASNAVYDNVLPIPTDQTTIDWATENLRAVGWSIGPNVSRDKDEQRQQLFAGDLMEKAYKETLASWDREDLSAPLANFASDWLNIVTGYDVSRVTIDRDDDGVEDPYDAYPLDGERWAQERTFINNRPDPRTPPFDVARFDKPYYVAPVVPETRYPFSDRIRFDTNWNRQNSMGTSRIEDYFAAGDRALPMKFLWQVFVVYQLSSGCTHCQVHGTRWLYEFLEGEHEGGPVPDEAMGDIYDLFDFERSKRFGERERAAMRFARDAGPLPGKTTPGHIEELRRYYADREIQELMMLIVAGSRLASGQQANVTVTDRTSMAWALRALPQVGWRPGSHLGLPQEQRRLFMSEIEMAALPIVMAGKEFDFASEWVGLTVPLATDTDGDGVDDTFDGFPRDRSRWEDTDRDGIEDRRDSDIDGDGLSNQRERELGTFPYKADSDGDGVLDADEVSGGTNPIDPRNF